MRALPVRLLAALTASTLLAAGASAQASFSTFGAGDSYNPVEQTIYTVPGASNWEASSFVWGGPSGALSRVRVAAEDQYPPGDATLFVSLLHGTSIGSASVLETWSLSSNALPDQIYSFSSVGSPTLVAGDTYWVELSSSYYAWGWNYDNTGQYGLTESADEGTTWSDYCTVCTAPAFDVTAGGVTPEPGTMTLLASGLVALAGIGRRRRRIR